MTKDQVKNAPDYDADTWNDDTRTQHGEYYGPYSRYRPDRGIDSPPGDQMVARR